MDFNKRWPEFLLPVGLIACLLVIFVPLPPAIMDMLLAANISIAVIILLATIYAKTPMELSVFPSLLLGTTLARLALNIGTTRLILANGATDQDAAAGGVIQGFGQFVAGDNIAIGLVIFAIIVVIQFVVITKGATRISEVSARFSLDGMPGKQMAIDADLNAGTIDAAEAQVQRNSVSAQADFYGAMDGASKFVRGDAIAGILITLINIAGGLIVGLSFNMSIPEAAETFTKLTIGDGLASQLPALLISLAAGLLVTRSTTSTDLPQETIKQIFGNPTTLVITAAFLGLMAFTQLPKLPLLLIAGACLATAYTLTRSPNRKVASAANQIASSSDAAVSAPTKPAEVTLDKLLGTDVMEMDLGIGLIALADPRQGGSLLTAITHVRKQLATELGIILPKIRIRDNLSLGDDEYRILIQGNPVDSGTILPDHFLAIDSGNAMRPLAKGTVRAIADENLQCNAAYWIKPETAETAAKDGYEIVSATDVLADQLKQVSAANAPALLTRDATRLLVDEIRKKSPTIVDELVPDTLSLGAIQRVLKNLVSENVSIRPLGLILETLGLYAPRTKNVWELTECVRRELGSHISSSLTNGTNSPISVFTISDELQDRIACAWEREDDEIRLNLPGHIVENLARAIQEAARQMAGQGLRPIALVQQSIRPVIAELAFDRAQEMIVLGNREIEPAKIQVVGEVTADQLRIADAA